MFITENISRLVSPIETFTKVEKILFDNDILENYGVFTGHNKLKLLFPNFYALGTEKAKRFVPLNPFVSYGKGYTVEAALASALMELAERYSHFKYMRTQSVKQASLLELGNEKTFYDFFQCLNKENLEILKEISVEDFNSYKFQWHKLKKINGEDVLAPMFLWSQVCGSNGVSSGNSKEEALLHGIYECVERHCMSLVLNEKRSCPEIPKEMYDFYPEIERSLNLLKSNGISYRIIDASFDLEIPVVGFICYFPNGTSSITFGVAGRLSEAIMRNITESSQLSDHPQLLFAKNYFSYVFNGKKTEEIYETFDSNINIELAKVIKIINKDIYYFDCSDPELNIPTVAVYVDGFLFNDATNGKDGKQLVNNMYSIVNAITRKGVF